MFKVNNEDTFIVNFTPCSSVSIVNFEHVIAGWDGIFHPIKSFQVIRLLLNR